MGYTIKRNLQAITEQFSILIYETNPKPKLTGTDDGENFARKTFNRALERQKI